MKSSSRAQKLGLAFGAFLGLFHLVWALLVALKLAQPLINFIFTLHMISPPWTIQPFSVLKALGLVLCTAIVGYVMGYVLGMIWEKMK